MNDGLKFFIGVVIACLIGAVVIQGALKLRTAQNTTIQSAQTKAQQLLQ